MPFETVIFPPRCSCLADYVVHKKIFTKFYYADLIDQKLQALGVEGYNK